MSNIHHERGTLHKASAECKVKESILLWDRPLQHPTNCFPLRHPSEPGLTKFFSKQALHRLKTDKSMQLNWLKVLQNHWFSRRKGQIYFRKCSCRSVSHQGKAVWCDEKGRENQTAKTLPTAAIFTMGSSRLTPTHHGVTPNCPKGLWRTPPFTKIN